MVSFAQASPSTSREVSSDEGRSARSTMPQLPQVCTRLRHQILAVVARVHVCTFRVSVLARERLSQYYTEALSRTSRYPRPFAADLRTQATMRVRVPEASIYSASHRRSRSGVAARAHSCVLGPERWAFAQFFAASGVGRTRTPWLLSLPTAECAVNLPPRTRRQTLFREQN